MLKLNSMIKKITFFLVLSFVSMHTHIAQNNSLRLTQQYLMSHKWYPDIYAKNDLKSSFITYTQKQEIDSVFNGKGGMDLYVSDYYLSETKDMYFDASKIGKTISGKYLITETGMDNLAYIMEVVSMSEEKMVLRHLTESFTSWGHTTTYYTSPLR